MWKLVISHNGEDTEGGPIDPNGSLISVRKRIINACPKYSKVIRIQVRQGSSDFEDLTSSHLTLENAKKDFIIKATIQLEHGPSAVGRQVSLKVGLYHPNLVDDPLRLGARIQEVAEAAAEASHRGADLFVGPEALFYHPQITNRDDPEHALNFAEYELLKSTLSRLSQEYYQTTLIWGSVIWKDRLNEVHNELLINHKGQNLNTNNYRKVKWTASECTRFHVIHRPEFDDIDIPSRLSSGVVFTINKEILVKGFAQICADQATPPNDPMIPLRVVPAWGLGGAGIRHPKGGCTIVVDALGTCQVYTVPNMIQKPHKDDHDNYVALHIEEVTINV